MKLSEVIEALVRIDEATEELEYDLPIYAELPSGAIKTIENIYLEKDCDEDDCDDFWVFIKTN